ncbi:MAG: ABC transporter permease [Pseudomonadales bacterium]|nr:ABC transporter permease [Pseudomonadales bacterium]
MSPTVIPLFNLALAFVPVAGLLVVLYLWSIDALHALYGVTRMLVQLLLIGYLLAFIFDANHAGVILGVLVVMVCAASWIALGNVPAKRTRLLGQALLAITVVGAGTLALVTQFVLDLPSWYTPQYVVPLAGMIFATSMNGVSLAVERLTAELSRDVPYQEARTIALNASLIPNINSLFAVGLVSLPGMMTGQILSGVDPFIAARYQIMVMCMLFTYGGFSAVLFLILARPILARNEAAEY